MTAIKKLQERPPSTAARRAMLLLSFTPDLTKPGYVFDINLQALFRLNDQEWEIAMIQLMSEGFPEPDPIIGGWYGPAVKAFLDRRHMMAAKAPARIDGEEKW